MKKKVLVFGPIADYGGRETEVALIVEALSPDYDVDVFTTSEISRQAHIYGAKGIGHVYSLKALILGHSPIIWFFAFLSFVLNNRKKNVAAYSGSKIIKRFFDYPSVAKKSTEKHLVRYDLVLICAQLSSTYLREVCQFCKTNGILVIFRTTGTITSTDFNYLDLVDHFLHHSEQNAQRLYASFAHKYTIVDQCALHQEKLLSLEPSGRSGHFLTVARLSPEKGVAELIEMFLEHCKDGILTVVGDGKLLPEMQNRYAHSNQIHFEGFVPYGQLHKFYGSNSALFISSYEETGPMSGIEAMAAALPVISTRVGAMPDRMKNMNPVFWFDIQDAESFKNALDAFRSLDQIQSSALGMSMRKQYLAHYSFEKIAAAYHKAVSELI